MKNHIPVLVVGKLSWKASGLFNPNAFPSALRSTAMNCGDQLALIENSLSNTTTLIEKQKIEFLKILQKDPSFKGFTPDPQKPAIAFHHNLAFPLLKVLTKSGDLQAKKVFREEIAKRFESGYVPVIS